MFVDNWFPRINHQDSYICGMNPICPHCRSYYTINYRQEQKEAVGLSVVVPYLIVSMIVIITIPFAIIILIYNIIQYRKANKIDPGVYRCTACNYIFRT